MRIKSAVSSVLIVSMTFFAAPAWACGAASAKTHIGQVLQVDREGGSFSIMDAEQMTAIRFAADGEILDKIENTDRMAIVEYQQTDDGLKATRVALQ